MVKNITGKFYTIEYQSIILILAINFIKEVNILQRFCIKHLFILQDNHNQTKMESLVERVKEPTKERAGNCMINSVNPCITSV